MRNIYKIFEIDANYSRLKATWRFLQMSKRVSMNNYDLLLENYMILIDKDVRDLYIKMNPQKHFTHIGEVDDFLNKHNTYIKMKGLIDENLRSCNRNNPLSVVVCLNYRAICPFTTKHKVC